VLLASCTWGSAGSSSALAQPDAVERALAYDPADPLGQLESADALDRAAGELDTRAQKPTVKAPAAGHCVLQRAGQRVWPSPAPPAIASVGDGFVIAGYDTSDGRERLFVVRSARNSRPEPITAFELQAPADKPRTLAPGLAARGENDLAVAFVDGRGRVWLRRLRMGRAGHGAPVEVGAGADPRFAAAVTYHGDRTLVAWTRGSTPMHTELTAFTSEDTVLFRRDVTPSAMGAAAPTFVVGANPPILIAADVRNGMSPILRIALGEDSQPSTAVVAQPVGMMSTPAQLSAAISQGWTSIGYAGLGSAATSAIGVVSLPPGRPSQGARTLVPGTAYGRLHVSAAPMPRAVLMAADAPVAGGTNGSRQIHVHVLRGDRVGPAAVVSATGGAARAAVAHGGQGDVAVAYTNDSGVYVAYLRCADGG
jgi:hypothetical protein